MTSLREFIKPLVFLSVFICIAGLTAFVENNTWAPIGPWGGTIIALIIDPQNPSRIFAGTSGGVFTSNDSGQNWIESNNGLAGGSVGTIAIDPKKSDTLFCARDTVYISTDAGRNWTKSGNLAVSSVTALAVHPLQTNVIYAGTYLSMGRGGNIYGLYKSVDGGTTWVQKCAVAAGLSDIALDPNDPNTIYLIYGWDVIKSTDGGAHVTRLDPGVPIESEGIFSLAINPVDPATIYAGTDAGVYKSSDGGATWFAKNAGLGSLHLREITIDPGNPSVLYVGTNNQGIYKSVDAGASWISVNAGLETARVGVVAIDPSDGNRVFAGTSLGVFKSANRGVAWNSSNSGLTGFCVQAIAADPLRRGTIYAATIPYYGGQNYPIFKTTDGGITWTVLNIGPRELKINVIAIDPNDSQTIYAGTYPGIFKSRDAGASWISVGLTDRIITAIAIDPHNPSVVYANGMYYAGGMFKSTDGGASWTALSNGLSGSIYALAIDPNNSATVYAAGSEHLLKSTDAGASWTDIRQGFENYFIAVAIDPQNSDIVYVIGGHFPYGVLKSENAGQTWVAANNGLPLGNFKAMAIDPVQRGTVYVVAEGSGVDAQDSVMPPGVYKTMDGGLHWARVNVGLRNLGVLALAVDPFDSATIYAATVYNGVSRITFGDCRVTFEAGAGGRISGSLDQVVPQGGKTSPVTAVPDPGFGLLEWTGPGGFTSTANPLVLDPVFQNLTTTAHFTTQPILVLSKTKLTFGSAQGQTTGSQRVLLTNRGGGTMSWTATPSQSWITILPSSGAGNAVLTVEVNPTGLVPGSYSGEILISAPQALYPSLSLQIDLQVLTLSGHPLGSFDTPIDGTPGITGAIPVSGWALDDIETAKIEIWRDAVTGETAGIWKIGDAIFVEGARPDVEQACPDYPLNYRAGWGYMLLTNCLPLQGNGTFKLYAFATDKEGNAALLGTKTITCSNATAVKPFGTIDTPGQGGNASGNTFVNFGWVLTPMPKTVPKDGSTISVWVDGVQVGALNTSPNVYNQYRVDVATAFPGLNNSGGPVGAFYLDTTKYANGIHIISWVATDDAGAADGIGSRYFNVMNTGASGAVGAEARAIAMGLPLSFSPISGIPVSFESLGDLPVSFNPVWVKRGFNRDRPAEMITPDNYGLSRIELEEVIPIEIDLAGSSNELLSSSSVNSNENPAFMLAHPNKTLYRGYQLVGTELRPLPIGSTLDTATGTFSWMPGPGFIGSYNLVFIREENGVSRATKIIIDIRPNKYQNEGAKTDKS